MADGHPYSAYVKHHANRTVGDAGPYERLVGGGAIHKKFAFLKNQTAL